MLVSTSQWGVGVLAAASVGPQAMTGTVSPFLTSEPQPYAYHDMTQLLTCVWAGPPQGQVSPDKAQGSPLHQERTFGLPLVAQAQ
jgi:hypothetical protein